jgi:hypothetical protein
MNEWIRLNALHCCVYPFDEKRKRGIYCVLHNWDLKGFEFGMYIPGDAILDRKNIYMPQCCISLPCDTAWMASTYCTRTITFHRAKRWCRTAVWNVTLPHIIFVQDGSISCSAMRCNWHGVEMFVGLRPIVSMLLLLPPKKAQIKSFGYLLLHTIQLYYNRTR